MGGSLGLALKQRAVCREVTGLVRREEAARQAVTLGVADRATTDSSRALSEADVVIFATPVRTVLKQLPQFAPYFERGTIVTDMGSTKQQIVRAMNELPDDIQPVGSHPMCGKETSGMAAADVDLFEGAPWMITPLDRTAPEAIATVQALAEAVGSKPRMIDAIRHDELVATISHLPYAIATTLVATAQRVAQKDNTVWEVAASGFRDTSRVAASNVDMWLDILLTNKAAIGHVLKLAREHLEELAVALAQEDEATLRATLESAAQQRRKMYR